MNVKTGDFLKDDFFIYELKYSNQKGYKYCLDVVDIIDPCVWGNRDEFPCFRKELVRQLKSKKLIKLSEKEVVLNILLK